MTILKDSVAAEVHASMLADRRGQSLADILFRSRAVGAVGPHQVHMVGGLSWLNIRDEEGLTVGRIAITEDEAAASFPRVATVTRLPRG